MNKAESEYEVDRLIRLLEQTLEQNKVLTGVVYLMATEGLDDMDERRERMTQLFDRAKEMVCAADQAELERIWKS